MKKTILITLSFLCVTCASSDDYDRPRQRPERMQAQAPSALDIIPLNDWWRQPPISDALNLSSDQFARLDKIAADQRDEITRLDRDSATAMRDLRQAFDTDPAGVDTAAQRVRSLRDSLFDRQVQMIASERDVLTPEQWRSLQRELQRVRDDRGDGRANNRGQGGRRGGMGGGRGRWPGF